MEGFWLKLLDAFLGKRAPGWLLAGPADWLVACWLAAAWRQPGFSSFSGFSGFSGWLAGWLAGWMAAWSFGQLLVYLPSLRVFAGRLQGLIKLAHYILK